MSDGPLPPIHRWDAVSGPRDLVYVVHGMSVAATDVARPGGGGAMTVAVAIRTPMRDPNLMATSAADPATARVTFEYVACATAHRAGTASFRDGETVGG